jgi:hypothetical protein
MSALVSRRSLLVGGAGAGVAVTVAAPAAQAAGVAYAYQVQSRYNYCSAASSRIALSAPILRRDSSENRTIPSQDSLARGLNLDPYDGDASTTGLKDPTLIATVLNNRLGIAGNARRYRLRISPSGTLYTDLQAKVRESVSAGYPVVINMNRVDGDYFDGHYIAIVGYGADRYQIADPYRSSRNGVWRIKQDIVDWNKLNRFTYYG